MSAVPSKVDLEALLAELDAADREHGPGVVPRHHGGAQLAALAREVHRLRGLLERHGVPVGGCPRCLAELEGDVRCPDRVDAEGFERSV